MRTRTIAIIMAFLLTGCVQRSQTGEEQKAVARHCQTKGMNVVLAYGGFPWGGLEYAECVKPPAGVTPAQFLN